MSTSVSALADPSEPHEDGATTRRGLLEVRLKGLVREPLLHFLILGIALFVIYRLITPPGAEPTSNHIELTQDDVSQLEVSWRAQWQRPPSADEMPLAYR